MKVPKEPLFEPPVLDWHAYLAARKGFPEDATEQYQSVVSGMQTDELIKKIGRKYNVIVD